MPVCYRSSHFRPEAVLFVLTPTSRDRVIQKNQRLSTFFTLNQINTVYYWFFNKEFNLIYCFHYWGLQIFLFDCRDRKQDIMIPEQPTSYSVLAYWKTILAPSDCSDCVSTHPTENKTQEHRLNNYEQIIDSCIINRMGNTENNCYSDLILRLILLLGLSVNIWFFWFWILGQPPKAWLYF